VNRRFVAFYAICVIALTRSQSRAVDRLAMNELGIPGIVLMENAARGLAALIPENEGCVAIVCGPGNNGGDGFAVARHLLNRGREVSVHLVASEEGFRAESDAGINLSILRAMGVPLRGDLAFHEAGVVVDALFGTGLDRPVAEPYAGAIRAINAAQGRVLAVDIPSGLDADSGAVLGDAVRADWTGTMVAPKIGFALGEGPTHTGEVRVVDIGAPPSLIDRVTA
jgi:NAD(P)H-hydrate epimerase